MSDNTSKTGKNEPIAFGGRLASSETFWRLFHEGMSLVEETAVYLEGAGKFDSRHLPPAGSVAFGTESMRLTTRLMQLASWLLLQRAINDGSMSTERAEDERSKVRLGTLATATEGPDWDGLPAALKGLIQRSLQLQERVLVMDRGLRPPTREGQPDNPVARAIGQIRTAFDSGQ
ncbi:MAG: protease adaptor protein RcdA [Alphaproteobacteria bacterium]